MTKTLSKETSCSQTSVIIANVKGQDPVSSRDRTRAQLVEVAAHLLAAEGPDAVTTRSVARAAGTGVVFTLIDEADDERDATLADTAWESVCATILTDASTAAITGPAAAAVTLRAALPGLTALTPAERTLLGDWLDRIADSR